MAELGVACGPMGPCLRHNLLMMWLGSPCSISLEMATVPLKWVPSLVFGMQRFMIISVSRQVAGGKRSEIKLGKFAWFGTGTSWLPAFCSKTPKHHQGSIMYPKTFAPAHIISLICAQVVDSDDATISAIGSVFLFTASFVCHA